MEKHPAHTEISRRQALTGLGGAAALAVLPGCATVISDAGTLALGPDALLENIAWNLMEHSPGSVTALGLDTGERAYIRSLLGVTSPAAIAAIKETVKTDLARARAYPKAGMTADQLTSFEVVESAYSTALDGLDLPYGDVSVGGWRNSPYTVIQNVGAYIDLPRFMESTHPLKSIADGDAYVARLKAIPGVLDGELTRITAAREMGMVPPDFLLDKAIGQMERSISNPGYSEHLGKSMADLGLSRAWGAEAALVVGSQIKAALERQLAELKAQRAVAGSSAGVWAQPRGDEYYRWALRAATTTTLAPDEIHQQGLDQLRSIQGRMDTLLHQIGYTSGTVGERMNALSDDPRYKFTEGDPGRKEIMDFIEGRIDWIKAQMPRAFNTLVDPNLEVRRLPLNEEPGGPSAYGGAGSKDGSIPGRMWINLRTTDLHRKFDLASLVYHETIPGHVWEGEYSNRLPLIRSILAFSAFSEGWALYGEQMAGELGAYDGQPEAELGYLQKAAWRAARMVVDSGMHAKRWPRAKAIEFFQREVALSEPETISEIDRYCSWPGQACAYMVGKLEILRQRDRAKAELGSTYDFKAFNDAVILAGNTPLDVLGKNVSRYIAKARA